VRFGGRDFRDLIHNLTESSSNRVHHRELLV
jgi:hypothetical protein